MSENNVLTNGSENLPISPDKTPVFNNYSNGIQAGTINGGISYTININVNNESKSHDAISQISPFGFNGAQAFTQGTNNAIEISTLNADYYNLFVLENEDYNNGVFCISKSVSLRRFTQHSERFNSLSSEVINDIQNMPCIFAKRNEHWNASDERHPFLVGKITSVTIQGINIKFGFKAYRTVILQNVLNNDPLLFGLATSSLRNEMDEEHWAIKQVDLIGVLGSLGITLE